MPPIAKISKEEILACAFTIVKKEGLDVLNARYLAKTLGYSTQPIFRVYENMECVKKDVLNKAEAYYNAQMMNGLAHPIPFLGMGLAYVQFAKEEKQLFKLLFLNDVYNIQSFKDMITGEDNKQVVEMIAHATNISTQKATNLFLNTWLLTHGIATVIATNSATISNTEVENILTKGFYGFLSEEKKESLND